LFHHQDSAVQLLRNPVSLEKTQIPDVPGEIFITFFAKFTESPDSSKYKSSKKITIQINRIDDPPTFSKSENTQINQNSKFIINEVKVTDSDALSEAIKIQLSFVKFLVTVTSG
jgi:hypothetical protein